MRMRAHLSRRYGGQVEPIYKWPLTNLVYAAICGVVGGILVAVGLVTEIEVLGPIGGLALIFGVLYLLAGLWGIARALGSEE